VRTVKHVMLGVVGGVSEVVRAASPQAGTARQATEKTPPQQGGDWPRPRN